MWLTMELRAVVVDMPFLKPCWCSTRLEAASIGPCRQLSSNLAAGERRRLVCGWSLHLVVSQASEGA